MRRLGYAVLLGVVIAVCFIAQPGSLTNAQQTGVWVTNLEHGDRASAHITDPPQGVGGNTSVVTLKNDASFAGFLDPFFDFLGADPSYSQWIDVTDEDSIGETAFCHGGASCIPSDGWLLIGGGTSAWRVTASDPNADASLQFSIGPNLQSFGLDLGILAIQLILALEGGDCLGLLTSDKELLLEVVVLASQIAPNFSGAAHAFSDGRHLDAVRAFKNAALRSLPKILISLGGMVAKDAVVSRVCAAIQAKLAVVSGGTALAIRLGVLALQKSPLIANYVTNVLLSSDPNTRISLKYSSSAQSPGVTPGPAPEPPPGECPPSGNVDVALILDSSGSMDSNDPFNQRLEAADVFVNNASDGDGIAVIDFDDSARVAHPITTVGSDRSALLSAIGTVDSDGGTSIGAGLQQGYEELTASSSGNKKAAVLLTDGRDGGSYNDDHLLYATNGWPVYVIGLGGSSNVDPAFLDKIASSTGTGQYIPLSGADQLVSVYFDIAREQKCGIDRLNETFTLSPQESRDFAATIPASQTSASFLVSWSGSLVDLILVDPNGRELGPSTSEPGITHAKGLTYELYKVENPAAGDWIARVYGADIPTGGEQITVQSASVPAPAPDIFSPPLLLAVTVTTVDSGGFDYALAAAATVIVGALILGGGGLWIFNANQGPFGMLTLSSPSAAATPFSIGRRIRAVTIGRSRSSDIFVDDPYASRNHARVYRAGESLVIEDLNSTGGTTLNGEPIEVAPLRDGDVIGIGESRLIFRKGRDRPRN